MNDTENETVRFCTKPNAFLYAFEVTWRGLLAFTAFGGIVLVFSPVTLLITYFLVGLALFLLAFVEARHLMFFVTDKKAIVRFSSAVMTTDELSIAIESVKHIDITSYGATYGSVYLIYEDVPSRKSKDGEPDNPQPLSMRGARYRRASVPITRSNSFWRPTDTWLSLHGFYAFEGFDEFAKIISAS